MFIFLFLLYCFFFQAEDGIRDLVRSRGLGDVYKRQQYHQTVTILGRQVQFRLCQDTLAIEGDFVFGEKLRAISINDLPV